jgi:serine/threonine-protein kinase
MLDDKYRIERLLATGGMGAVYVGTHVGLRKRVAIKVLNPQLSTAPMIERFHREAITASQIGHEGIAQVTDLGTSDEGEPFLVMEYLEGESLASRLKTRGPLDVEDACELGCAILSPLAAAHEAGIVHRDLKPDNVFLVRQSRGEMVKLLDFGISRTTSRESSFRLTTTGLVLGTPYYMSPEQARGDSQITLAADLYAFGVILYEMLVGDVPMRADNYNQLMYRVMMGEYQWPRQRRPDLPEALEQIIVRSMALAPHERPGSANELEQALLPFCRQIFRDHATGKLSAPGLAFRGASARRSGAIGSGGIDYAMLAGSTLPEPPPDSGHPGLITPSAIAGIAGIEGAITARKESAAHETVPEVMVPDMPDASGTDLAAPRRSRLTRLLTGVAILVACGVIAATLTIVMSGKDPAPATTPAQPAAVAAPAPAASPPAPAEPPAPVPSPPAHIEAPAEPATITLRLAVDPPGSVVTLDGKRVTGAELVVPRDAGTHRLKITAAGYLGHEEAIAFDESQRLVVQLKRVAAAPGRGKPKDHTTDRIDSQSPYD